MEEKVAISREELDKVLEAHRKWVESEGKEGERADLFEANLQEANLFKANLQEAYLRGANLYEANLYRASLQEAYLYGANLQGAKLDGANLYEANLYGANLPGAYLHRANLQGAYLRGANLQEAYLTDADGLTASQVKAAVNWRLAFYTDDFLKELGLPPDHSVRLEKKNLSGYDLQGAKLLSADLQRVNLRGANLQEADLENANLQEADLENANLQGADLRGARNLTASQVKKAKNWQLAFYSDDLLKELGLPPDHNERVKKKLAELEKEKKAEGDDE